ncbi:MAG: hypothetical protein ACRDF4_07655 [Rhabdochlamydiaceae bacterium]
MRIDRGIHATIKHRPSFPAYSSLENFDGSFICPYPLDMLTLNHRKWFVSHLQNHDTAIFAPKSGAGFVMTSA